jgi:hypothetical protein
MQGEDAELQAVRLAGRELFSKSPGAGTFRDPRSRATIRRPGAVEAAYRKLTREAQRAARRRESPPLAAVVVPPTESEVVCTFLAERQEPGRTVCS